MVARTRTQAELDRRDTHMENAQAYALELVRDAALRGLTGYDVTVSIASVLAARNPTLAGKVLVAVGDAIRMQPITKIIPLTGDDISHGTSH